MRTGNLAWTVLLFVVAGCGTGPDDTTNEDGGTPSTACERHLEGESPFGARLTGDVDLSVEGQDAPTARSMVMNVYFPAGRVPGGTVLLTGPAPYLRTVEAELDADGSAELQWIGKMGHEDVVVRALLREPGGGISVTMQRNLAAADSDVPVMGTGSVVLCATGEVPEPVLTADETFGPSSAIAVGASAPIDEDSVESTVIAGGRTVAPLEFVTYDRLHFWPGDLVFPPTKDVVLDITAKDVLGRTFTVENRLEPLTPTGTLQDPSFDTGSATQPGIAANVDWTVEAQALTLNTRPVHGRVEAVIALPDTGDATSVQVAFSRTVGCLSLTADLVDASGRRDYAGAEGMSGVLDLTPLPPGRPLWLALGASAEPYAPQQTPPAPCVLTIEDIAFSP